MKIIAKQTSYTKCTDFQVFG